MKRTIGWTAHAATLAAVLLAIWLPFGGRGQWIATAVVLLILGAMFLGSPESRADRYTEVPLRDDEVLSGTDDAELDKRLNARPTYGKKAEDDR